MNICFISLELTVYNCEHAKIFFETCKSEMDNYVVDYVVIKNIRQIPVAINKISNNTLIIMFNNKENSYDAQLTELIAKANANNAKIWTIAIDKDCREPLDLIKNKQSFEVWDKLRVRNFKVYNELKARNLGNDNIKSIALLFSRKIISYISPTLCNEDFLLFVSHRRLDGEDLTARLCDKLKIQAKNDKTFRDVTDVEVGEETQEVIKSALGRSDVLIFLHTPQSAKSEWIEKELRFALLNNIPIIWIQIDDANIDTLPVKPGDKPNISCNSEDFNKEDKLTKIIDDILSQSFHLVMEYSYNIYDQINTFKDFCQNQHIKFTEESFDRMIYCLSASRKGYFYTQREIKQYVQYFGKRYSSNDIIKLNNFLDNKKYKNYNLYDSAIILSNNINYKRLQDQNNNKIIEENCEDFYYRWREYMNKVKVKYDEEIVISGAFSECEEIYKQSLTDAVNLFSKEILKSGLTLVFGSHPTFQNIIFEIGQKVRPEDYKKAIKMYISKFFKERYNLFEIMRNATVYETEKVGTGNSKEDREESLALMRNKMINRENVKALICMGGKIKKDANLQGIDSEIKIARASDIPVFLVGSVGGRSSQLATEYKKCGKWNELNGAPNELNEQLLYGFDYRKLANEVINFLKND